MSQTSVYPNHIHTASEVAEGGNRALCLYRVSSTGQLYRTKENEADIPMQRLECRRFAEQMGWNIIYEFQEEGVSGHKVRAEQRDKIQKVKELAKQKKFDIFLVFMFDRIGRIADETPFVVEWLINAGIRVWSTQEGEQKIESHTDRLTNYIRFWQADGESQKTSIRTATRLGQITEEGHFTGGACPYGYSLVKKGRSNKKGVLLNDLEINEEEAPIVRLIFDKYVNEGYGPQRIANYLRQINIKNREDKNWHPASIRGMLRNLTYTGVLRCGQSRSPFLPELQIIDQTLFDRAQEIMSQRSGRYEQTRSVPLNTRSKSLLAGNVFCGHCGARLSVTTNGKGSKRTDGTDTIRMRYVCQTKTRTHDNCNGQTGYTVHILDDIVNALVHQIFQKIGGFSETEAVQRAYEKKLNEKHTMVLHLQREITKTEKDLKNLRNEVLKSLAGQSSFETSILNRLIKDMETKCQEQKAALAAAQQDESEAVSLMQQMCRNYSQFVQWSDVYDTASMETKKMIVSQLFERIEVSRGYHLKVRLAITVKQFLTDMDDSIVPDKIAQIAASF